MNESRLLLDVGRPRGRIERYSWELEFLSDKGPEKTLGKEGVRRAAALGGQRRVRDAMEQDQPAADD